MRKLFFLFLFLPTLSLAYYGEDNRLDFYQVSDPAKMKIAKAMAYQVERHYELRGWTFNRYWTIVTKKFVDHKICPEEKYVKQPSMRKNCTGILVAPDVLLTAGNCITEHYCYNDLYYWMFDYNLKNENSFKNKRSKKNFYLCDKVIKRIYDPSKGISLALLKLKKKVSVARPVKISKESSIKLKDQVYVMGHPYGLPLKLDNHAEIQDLSEEAMILNTDLAAMRTKGAGVFNKTTNELEAFLVYGTTGYEKTDRGCLVESINDEADGSELAIRASVILKYLK